MTAKGEGDDGCSIPSVEPELSSYLIFSYFKKRASSNDSLRLSIQYTVRPNRAERIEMAFALPCFFSSLATKLFVGDGPRSLSNQHHPPP